MKKSRTLLIMSLLVLIALGVGVWLYPQMPARVPSHWDAAGQVNGWMSPFWAVAMWPLLMAATAVLLWVLPAISPRRFEIKPFAHTYEVLLLAIEAFLLVVGVCVMLAGAGYAVPIPRVVTLAVGALFVVLGNYMGKLRKNFFVGIRTPWTLANDEVWERTHRLAGWLFVAAGVLIVITGIAALPPAWMIGIVVAVCLIPYLYSYLIYRRVEGRPGPGGA